MSKFIFFSLLFWFSSLFTAIAAHPNVSSLTEKGKTALSNKDFESAYQAFQEAFMASPEDLEISFYLGRAAFEKGDYETALMAFDRVLIMNPDAIRVKLEIARCHMNLGAYQTAKQYFYEVLNSKPPKPVVDNIEIFLAAIKASEKKHFISGMLSLGLSLDDNVRSAPGDFVYNGFSFPINLTSDPDDDQIYSLTAAVNHIYRFEDTPYSWKTTVTNVNNFYDDYKDLDIHYVGISTGPVYQGSNYLAELHGSLNNITLGYDEYVQPTGLGGSVTFIIGPQLLLNSAVSLEKKKYSRAADIDKDATNYSATVSPALILGNNRLTATFAKERENADASPWSYDRFKWGLRYDRSLPADINLSTGFSIKHSDYDISDSDPAIRKDKVSEFTLGAGKTFWKSVDGSKNITGQLNWTYTDSESNNSIYNYRKKVLASLLSCGF